MAQLALTIGAGTVTVEIRATDAQTRAAMRRYAEVRGLTLAGRTNAQIAEDVLRSLLKIVADASMGQQREELLAAQRAALETQLNAENDLADGPYQPPTAPILPALEGATKL
jgi:hypothetical protein